MALPKDPNFKVYDPRRGEDWKQPRIGGELLSMRDQGFVVVDYWPGRHKRLFELDDFEELIRASIAATGTLGFISVSPFTNELGQRDLVPTVQWNAARYSAIGYFVIDIESIRQHVALLRLASHEDWVVGSCNGRFDDIPERGVLRPVVDWNIEFLFTQINNIGSATLYSSETGIIRVYTRIYSGLDEHLQRLGAQRRL